MVNESNWETENEKELYPQGHFQNLSYDEQQKFFGDFEKMTNLSKEKKQTILKNRNYAFWALNSLEEDKDYVYVGLDFNSIAYHVTYFMAHGKITKAFRAHTDSMLRNIIPMLVAKGQISFHGGKYKLTEKGKRALTAYRGGNIMCEAFIHATNRKVAYAVMNNLAFKFYCEHNVKRTANPFRDNEDAEQVGMFVYNMLVDNGVMKEYHDFKKQGITDEPMYYIEADIFMHFKKLMALRFLKGDGTK